MANHGRQPGELGITPCHQTAFHWGKKTYIMGIINVSPDSFAGDGAAKELKLEEIGKAAKRFPRSKFVNDDNSNLPGKLTHPPKEPRGHLAIM